MNETNDASFYDNNGKYDEKHGPVINHLDEIEKQKNDERHFAAVIQAWLRPLLFDDQKEQVEKDYLDLSTIHYPNHKKYLDFMALKEGSVDRQSSLAYKEILVLILLVIEYFRTGLQKYDFDSFKVVKNPQRRSDDICIKPNFSSLLNHLTFRDFLFKTQIK